MRISDAGNQVKCIKNQIEEMDPVNYSYKYSLIEGDGLLMDKIEKITYKKSSQAKKRHWGCTKLLKPTLQNPDAYA
ncbi:hypothetical protein ACOSQ2_016677 [Xanthoceras sorbifolium]